MDEEQLLNQITQILKTSIQTELKVKRPSRGYDGRIKPNSGRYPTPYNDRVYTGNLLRSVTVGYELNEQTAALQIVVSFPNAPEWIYVNSGRRGKQQSQIYRYPPLSKILTWVRRRTGVGLYKNPDGTIMSKESQAFLIQRSIGEYGIYPTNFVSKGFERARDMILKDLGLFAQQYFETLIQNKIILRTNTQR
jgi:hypothetical protein